MHAKFFCTIFLVAVELSYADPNQFLIERGLVVSQGRQGVSSSVRGTIESLTTSGTAVKKGDFLFELDTSNMQLQRDEKFDLIERLKRELTEKEKSIDEKEALYGLMKKWLVAKVEHQKLQYKLATRRLPTEEERIATIPLEITQLKLEAANEALNRQQRLIEAGFAAASSITSKQLKVKGLELQLLQDQQSLTFAKDGATPEDELELNVKLEVAQAELDRQQAEHDHEMKILKSQLSELQLNLENAQIQFHVIENNLKNTKVVAQKEGVWVLKKYRDWWRGGTWTDIHLGVNVDEYQVVGDLIDPNVLSIEVLLHEADRLKIEIDQRCELKFPALNGATVQGVLGSISKIAKDRLDLAQNGTEVQPSRYGLFQVLITPDSILPDLKPGMSAIVSIPLKATL